MARPMFSESANPVLKDSVLQNEAGKSSADYKPFTISGAINKSFFLLAILLLGGVISFMNPHPILTWGGAIGGLMVVFLAVRRKERSATYAPIYAALEGLFVGGASALYAEFQEGIVLQAVSLTVMVFFVMLMVNKSGLIPVTNKFRKGVIMATGAIFLIYITTFILSLFGVHVPYIHEGGTFGILFSLAVLGIASLNLLLDFDLFEKAEEYRAPEYMEWFAGMSLLITLVWIYIEILHLLARLRD